MSNLLSDRRCSSKNSGRTRFTPSVECLRAAQRFSAAINDGFYVGFSPQRSNPSTAARATVEERRFSAA
jgi:hypothetical protein